MIRELQKKFIFAAMTAVSILLIALLGAINLGNIFITFNQIDQLLEEIVQGEIVQNEMPQGNQPPSNPGDPAVGNSPKPFNDRRMSSVFFVARVSENGDVIQTDTSRIIYLTEEEAKK